MNTLFTPDERPTILAVDDAPDNLTQLVALLLDDYRIKAVNNGEKALKIVRSGNPPNLILLDIMMPGLDGYEVCRRLKADEDTRDIPVIFLTALTDTEDERKGMEMGAVDYITKPISPAILLARVRIHLELKRHRDNLAALVATRTRELEEAHNRLKALDAAQRNYLRAISHELRTPANGALGIAELAIEELEDEEQRASYAALFNRSRDRLLMTIDAALQLAELQGGTTIPTVPVDLDKSFGKAWESLRDDFKAKDLSFVMPHLRPEKVLGSEELLSQSLTTLLKAVQRLAMPVTTVMAEFGNARNHVSLSIDFQGRSLPEGMQKSFFDTFSTARTGSFAEDLGLAVPLAAEIVRAMGGTVELLNTNSGWKIYLTLKEVLP